MVLKCLKRGELTVNIFDQYGIKEVADVTLYSIHKKKDGSGDVYYVPALYLDSLKISTVEKTAESTWAQGGYGNARLINWDYGKQINVTLEDALCTPASLGLCWNGTLNADWKDGSVDIKTDACYCQNPLTKLSRMEKAIFPRERKEKSTVSELLPQLSTDVVDRALDILKISSVVDGTNISGNGVVRGHTYRWKMAIESGVKSIAQVPDRFFDVKGVAYPIDVNRKVSVASLPDYENYKDAIIYRINSHYPIAPPLAKIIFDYNQGANPTYADKEFYCVSDSEGKMSIAGIIEDAYQLDTDLEEVTLTLATAANNEYVQLSLDSDSVTAGISIKTITSTADSVTIDSVNKRIYPKATGRQQNVTIHVSLQSSDERDFHSETITAYCRVILTGGPSGGVAATGIYGDNTYTTSVYYGDPSYSKVTSADGKGYVVYENGAYVRNTGSMAAWDVGVPLVSLDTLIEPEYDETIRKYIYHVIVPTAVFSSGQFYTEMITKRDMIATYDADAVNSSLVYYLQNHAMTDLFEENGGPLYDKFGSVEKVNTFLDIDKGDYLAIIVDNNDNYKALIGKNTAIVREYANNGEEFAQDVVTWHNPTVNVDVTQFKGLDMWIRFQSINEMIYFLITKYENDIISINPATLYSTNLKDTALVTPQVNSEITTKQDNSDLESAQKQGKLWAYINPRTMKPYADDYWFHNGEPLYVRSLTLAENNKRLKGNKIVVRADEWPGMYMFVGETYIRDKDTGEDERLQIKIPLCKVKSDHTLTLQADGDPTTFNLNLEVARPTSGAMMEITSYEVAKKLIEGSDGCFYAADGATEVVSE